MLNLATAFLLAASLTVTPEEAGSDILFRDGYDASTCPDGRVVRSDISYAIGSAGTRHNVDLTAFENIWGHSTDTDSTMMWPGRPGSSTIIEDFDRYGYVAAKFHTPPGLPITLFGMFKNVQYPTGPSLDFSISEQCADFYPQQSGCLATDIVGSDAVLVSWRTQLSNYFCVLEPDTDYFVNMRLATPDNDPMCRGPYCLVHTLNYYGGN